MSSKNTPQDSDQNNIGGIGSCACTEKDTEVYAMLKITQLLTEVVFKYLFLCVWPHQVLAAAHTIFDFRCGMQDI